MEKACKTENNKTIGSFLRWVLWWRVDIRELDRQIRGYESLKLAQSARGQSFLLHILAASATTFFILSSHSNNADLGRVFLFLLLGYLIYRGNEWAMVGAMILWSIGKFYLLYVGLKNCFVSISSSAPNLLLHMVWWAFVMHMIYLAYTVERRRKLKTVW